MSDRAWKRARRADGRLKTYAHPSQVPAPIPKSHKAQHRAWQSWFHREAPAKVRTKRSNKSLKPLMKKHALTAMRRPTVSVLDFTMKHKEYETTYSLEPNKITNDNTQGMFLTSEDIHSFLQCPRRFHYDKEEHFENKSRVIRRPPPPLKETLYLDVTRMGFELLMTEMLKEHGRRADAVERTGDVVDKVIQRLDLTRHLFPTELAKLRRKSIIALHRTLETVAAGPEHEQDVKLSVVAGPLVLKTKVRNTSIKTRISGLYTYAYKSGVVAVRFRPATPTHTNDMDPSAYAILASLLEYVEEQPRSGAAVTLLTYLVNNQGIIKEHALSSNALLGGWEDLEQCIDSIERGYKVPALPCPTRSCPYYSKCHPRYGNDPFHIREKRGKYGQPAMPPPRHAVREFKRAYGLWKKRQSKLKRGERK